MKHLLQWIKVLPPEKREILKGFIENEVMKEFINVLKEDNAMDSSYREEYQIPGCTVTESIALEAQRRAGFHQAIKTIERIHFLNPNSVEEAMKRKKISESWDHIGEVPRTSQRI